MSQANSNQRTQLSVSRRMRYALEAAGFFLAIGFFRLFSLDTASCIGGWIGRKILAPTGLSKTARRNLQAAFPDLSDAAREKILLGMWDNLGRVVAEYGHLKKLHSTGHDPRIEVSGVEHIDAVHKAGKGLLLISGHFANWELLPTSARDRNYAGASVVRPTNNPFVNRWLERERTANGLPELIAKGAHGTRRIFTLLRKGDAVCMLVDQRASEGVNAPFFGQDAPTTPVPAILAQKLGAVIIPVSNERLGGARFRVRVHPPIVPANTGNPDRDVLETTAAINAFIEARIRENPPQWLWLHRRWATPGSKLRKRGAQVLSSATSGPSGNSATSNRV